VIHPARDDHPQHDLFERDFSGSGGLFAAVLKPVTRERLAAMLDNLELFGSGLFRGADMKA
jgi:Cystathionine beta-lyases/cystathionine gamma-synthases